MIRKSVGPIRLRPGRNSSGRNALHHGELAPRDTVVHQEITSEMSFHQYALESSAKENNDQV